MTHSIDSLLNRTQSVSGPHDAIYLGEGNPHVIQPIDRTGMILLPLSATEREYVLRHAKVKALGAKQPVLTQGKPYNDIFLITSGRVRTYYVSPVGREFTLAYWTPGHFVGVPELFGTGENLWSAETTVASTFAMLSSETVRKLLVDVPVFGMSLVEGLNFKGRILSASLQMLGTRSVTGRLAQLLLTLASRHGIERDNVVTIQQRFTHEELANMIGATRQWVTTTIADFNRRFLVDSRGQHLRLTNREGLAKLVR